MIWIPDDALARLQRAAAEPDFSGTRYSILAELGRGGMATVYLARDHELDREVALKVLDIPDENGELRERMLREARIVARLEHPGIVPIHDAGVLPDDRVYYAMKLVKGQRLDAFAERDLPEKLRVFEKVCEAVAFAHASGVIHRDLKPENIMVGGFGEVLVMDWGLAKSIRAGAAPEASGRSTSATLQARQADTSHGAVLGTPAYMAPEQARGEVNILSERTDVYALGATLYFLLTGLTPATQPPRQVNPRIGRSLEAICLKAMSADPQQRYATADELRKDIVAILEDRPVSAYRENVFEKLLRWLTRNHFVVILVLAYLIMRALILLFLGR